MSSVGCVKSDIGVWGLGVIVTARVPASLQIINPAETFGDIVIDYW